MPAVPEFEDCCYTATTIVLLFYNRNLKLLVAIELKLGKFEADHKEQIELYLKWLSKYEKKEGELPPVDLILCAESSKEQISGVVILYKTIAILSAGI